MTAAATLGRWADRPACETCKRWRRRILRPLLTTQNGARGAQSAQKSFIQSGQKSAFAGAGGTALVEVRGRTIWQGLANFQPTTQDFGRNWIFNLDQAQPLRFAGAPSTADRAALINSLIPDFPGQAGTYDQEVLNAGFSDAQKADCVLSFLFTGTTLELWIHLGQLPGVQSFSYTAAEAFEENLAWGSPWPAGMFNPPTGGITPDSVRLARVGLIAGPHVFDQNVVGDACSGVAGAQNSQANYNGQTLQGHELTPAEIASGATIRFGNGYTTTGAGLCSTCVDPLVHDFGCPVHTSDGGWVVVSAQGGVRFKYADGFTSPGPGGTSGIEIFGAAP